MAGKLLRPWRFHDILQQNKDSPEVSLPWAFRLEVLERLAKILSRLHRRKVAYGVGNLNAKSLYFGSSAEYGLASLDYYPNILEILENDPDAANERTGDLSKIDVLCFGVLALQIMTEKPLHVKRLPQLNKLLLRNGLGEPEDVQLDDFFGEDDTIKRALRKEKSYRNGTSQEQAKDNLNRYRVEQKHSKKDSSGVTKIDEYALAPIIRDELRDYLKGNVTGFTNVQKPGWVLSLEELVAVCLSAVEESRPISQVARNWMLEILQSFRESKSAHEKASDPAAKNGLDSSEAAWNSIYSIHNDFIRLLHEVPVWETEVILYHSTDEEGEISDSESLDSFMPPEKFTSDIDGTDTDTAYTTDTRTTKRTMETMDTGSITLTIPPSPGPNMLNSRARSLLTKMDHDKVGLGKGGVPRSRTVAELFDKQQNLTYEQARDLLKKAREIFDNEKNILVCDAPVTVVGDIHGQYFDLRNFLKKAGRPKRQQRANFGMTRKKQRSLMKKHGSSFDLSNPDSAFTSHHDSLRMSLMSAASNGYGTMDSAASLKADQSRWSSASEFKRGAKEERNFLFLGDYVDRGYWSCEVLFYLLSLKIEYPKSIFMLRGNHECDTMADVYGFRDECEHKYGREIYHRCLSVFNALPIACLINIPNQKRFLACHGGISDKVNTLEQLGKLNRFREPGVEGTLCDLLWSDPVPNNVVESMNLDVDFKDIEYLPNETRGCSKKFGYAAIEKFLEENKLVGLIRAHEAKEEGFQFHFQKYGTKGHLVATVFSAPNYMEDHGNKGAVMIVHPTVDARLAHQERRFNYKYSPEELLRSGDIDKDEYVDLLEPVCYNEVVQPQIVDTENRAWTLLKDVQASCPYMPVTMEDFYHAALNILSSLGTAKAQLEAYRKQLEAKEHMKQVQNSLRKKFQAAMNGSLRSSNRFDRAMQKEKISEVHPDVLKEKMRHASQKLENMEAESMRRSVGVPQDIGTLRESSRDGFLSFRSSFDSAWGTENFRESLASTGSTGSDVQEIMDAINGRSFMKREVVAIENSAEWVKVLALWFDRVSERRITRSNFWDELGDGVVLCEVAMSLRSRQNRQNKNMKFWTPKENSSLNGFQIRQNLLIFQDICKELDIHFMFLMSDLRQQNEGYVLPALIELARLAKKKKKLKIKKLPRSNSTRTSRQAEDWRTRDLEVGNVTFTSHERLMIQYFFLMIDRDDSGFIEVDEILTWAREEGIYIRPSAAARAISACDYDNDKCIGLRDFFQFAAVLKETYEAQELEGYRTAEDGDYSDDEYHSVYDFAEVDGENSEFDGEWSDDDFGMYGDVDAYHTMI